jgi:DNA-binding transcriptional ArsR family regulator
MRTEREVAGMSATTTDIYADLNRLRLNPASFTPAGLVRLAESKATPKPKVQAKRIAGEFLKGPIPLPWLTAVTRLSGKAPLAVALAVCFEAGRRKSNEVKLTTAILRRFSVNRKAKYRALKSLEEAGLVRVRREPRRNPVVTILDLQGEPGALGTSQGVALSSVCPEPQRSPGYGQNGGT